MSTQVFGATGLTCGHCVAAVKEEVGALAGVSAVDVVLVEGGTSTVTVSAEPEVTEEKVAEALEEAGGYALVR
ncbi:MAG TPA: cation transporter [Dermatophilaceae bacterium]|nr:cation transporter [Dermatophilaceae bacterium]